MKLKCKCEHDNKKCEKCEIKYKYCRCCLKYTDVKDDLIEYKGFCCKKDYRNKVDKTFC